VKRHYLLVGADKLGKSSNQTTKDKGKNDTMRKLIAIFALAVTSLATASATITSAPPDCGDACPWVASAPPDCGDACPWVMSAPPDCGDACPWVR
jgi:hypothetical protein